MCPHGHLRPNNMYELADIYRLLNAFVTGTLLGLSLLLAFLRVPASAEWQSLRKAKGFTALACIVLGIAYGSSALMGWTFGVPVLLVWFVVASLQALLFTFTCVIFVAPQTPMRRLVLWNIIPIAALTALMASAFTVSAHWGWILLVAAVVCYLVQLGIYTRHFTAVYRTNIEYLEEVYADDLASRLAWVRRLFFSALAVGVLAAAVILLADQSLDTVFGLVVAVYYTHVAISFVNYVSCAAFVVKAAIEQEKAKACFKPTEHEQARPTVGADNLAHVREAIDAWAAAKHYLEPDVSVEEIAQQMGISRQVLNDYFATVLQTPFRSWRIELRIREAQRLLTADPAIPTGELCARCGYNDRSNFHKHFLKFTGQSLAEYRSGVQEG